MTEYRAPVVSCVGAGQLARMLQSEASELGVQLRVLATNPDECAAYVCPQTVLGQPTDQAALADLLAEADALTVEHELIPDAVFAAAQDAGVPVHPSREALLYAKDKIAMRTRLGVLGLPMPGWADGADEDAVAALGDKHGWPLVAKVSHGGYDGRGVALVNGLEEFREWQAGLAPEIDGSPRASLVEARVPFTRELAVMAARRPSGEMRAWPAVQTWQEEGQCAAVLAPAPDLDSSTAVQAVEIALRIGAELSITGVYAVEMFLVEAKMSLDQRDRENPALGVDRPQLFINELAMRPHNSGHWTQDGCVTSQFEQHLRAVLDLPLGETSLLAPYTAMGNILGSAHADPGVVTSQVAGQYPEAKLHLYRKGNRQKRKIGHVNVCAQTPAVALATARRAADMFMGK